MKKITFALTVLISSGLFAACTHQEYTATPAETETIIVEDAMEKEVKSMVIALNEENASGQSGTATLVENDAGQLTVTLQITGGEYTAPQPAHIHVGACPEVGTVEYPLTNVVGGNSVTVLDDVSLASVTGVAGGLAINVHKSAAESSVYTACGNLL
ncbi:MAG: hypothetical protein BroJett025_02580 [Patescibacteria group bacterium]|nr:MAG: hypothetical protein BroJett025_02580 [Patescibacteria group bacterium]